MDDLGEAQYTDLKRAIHKSQKDVERFAELLDGLKKAASKSNDAHRQNTTRQILIEMVQEIRQVRIKLEKTYFLPSDAASPSVSEDKSAPEGSVAVFSRTHARLAAMEEICRVCSQMQEPAIQKQGHALKEFIGKSQEFYEFMQEDYRVTRALLPAKY